MARQSDLASRLAPPLQNAAAQLKSLRQRKPLQRRPSDHLCLVEPALALLVLVQRNGNDCNRSAGYRLLQLGYRVRQHAPKDCGRWANLLELENVNQITKPSVVTAISDSTFEWRLRPLAKQALSLFVIHCRIESGRRVQRLAADVAERPMQRPKSTQATLTNGKPGYFNERRSADTAIGGKECEK